MSSCCGRDSKPGNFLATSPSGPRIFRASMRELWPNARAEERPVATGKRSEDRDQKPEDRKKTNRDQPVILTDLCPVASALWFSPELHAPVVVRGGVTAEVPVPVFPFQGDLPPAERNLGERVVGPDERE